MYRVKEIFNTLQGEGANAGIPAVFLRFAGCNLRSGRERHRAAAICRFCDTDFVGTDGPGGGKFRSATAPEVVIRGTPRRPHGFVADFAGLEKACHALRGKLDHALLNEVRGLKTPSLEHLCIWIWERLAAKFPDLSRVTVRRDLLGQSCAYHGPQRELPAVTPQTNKQRR